MIRLAKPWIGEDEQRAVAAVLESGMLVQGAMVRRFEQSVAALVGRRHAVAVSSGTAALELALEAMGVGADDEVLCPAFTWPSPAHAARRVGARVRFIDVDPDEWNARGQAFQDAIGPATKAVVVIDQFGSPARAAEIRDSVGAIPIIEDAACALGSLFADGACGSLGKISCMSFHPRKIITTGEGGICLTDDGELAERIRVLRNHGQSERGFEEAAGNFRMTEMAAALGFVQLQRLDEIVGRRREIAATYRREIDDRVETQSTPEGSIANHQTFGIVLPDSIDKQTFITTLREGGVEAGLLSHAVHRLETFAKDGSRLPATEHLAKQGVALPLYPQMRNAEVETVIGKVNGVLRG